MFAGMNNTKEVIKGRMLKHALNFWNIKNTEDLDPVVKLLLEALSNELYNFGNDIRDTEVRLLEKIAHLLAPEFLTCPNTAHAIVHATPVEVFDTLEDTTHFYTQVKIAPRQEENSDVSTDIFFTPVNNVKILDAHVSCYFSGNSLYDFTESYGRQQSAQTIKGKYAEPNTCWLGLSINEKLTDINGLHFYFDWKNSNVASSQVIYQLLPLSKWSCGTKSIAAVQGLQYESNKGSTSQEVNLFTDHNLLSLMEKDTTNYYDNKFITLVDEVLKNVTIFREPFPEIFRDYFSENDLTKIQGKKIWLKIVFPPAMQQEWLDELFVYTNCFPVMNRQLIDLKYRLKGSSNIVPLKTEGLEQFLAVRSFSDESHTYHSTPYRKLEEEATGTYTLRHGGVERFDERNAKELIGYLLELLRSEVAAFSTYGYDFIASTLKEISQRIALMEQKTKNLGGDIGEIPNYVIVKPFDGQDIMYAEYWTTLAETANMLRSGTRLQLHKGTKVKADSLLLMSTTTGGNNRLKPEERLNAFRYGLITRNRVITKEDIRNLCFYELGNRISRVTIQRGFEMSPLPSEAFTRTIDIIITPVQGEKLSSEAWQVLLEQLKTKLQSRSGMSCIYRVLLDSVL